MSAARLYTPELLGLAVELARYPLEDTLRITGEARSPACGSTLTLSLALDDAERIARVGLRVRACAIGQAAAAIFARHAAGRDGSDLAATLAAMRDWLAGEGASPAWPDLVLLEPARGYSGRHGAILLPWLAATSALSTVRSAS